MIFYKKTLALLALIAISLLSFSSCTPQNNNEAYCFSIVFEKNNSNAIVTMYCKTKNNDGKDGLEEVKFPFSGEDFKQALSSSEKGKYSIYYNSIVSYYISGELEPKDKKELTLLLLNNSKYKTDNHTMYNKTISSNDLHKYAKDTCKNESINRIDYHKYGSSLSILRQIY